LSVAHKAARGALWTIISSMGGRAIGVVGTLAMTRFLHPKEIGEINDASVIALSASWLSIWGWGQYAVVKGRGEDAAEVTFHAFMGYFVVGTFVLGLAALFGGHLAPFFGAPEAAAFIPGLCLAAWIRRFGAIPERVLSRTLNFRAAGIAAMMGELVYTITALSFAYFGYGGWSIVIANIVQSTVAAAILIRAAGFASWLTPCKLSWSRYKAMLKFGLPLGIQGFFHGGSRYWDNLAISHFFGPAATGTYNMAYNLADIPAIQIGEQIALVLMPSMAELPPERRPRALERSTALLSLIIFPLAVGLGLVAAPLIDLLLPANDWQMVAPLLTVLACLSVFRPITWVVSAYMEAESKTNRLMILEILKVALLIGGIAALQQFGLRAAAGAVGVAFGATALAGVAIVVREGVSGKRLFIGFFQPLVCCAIMGAVTFGVHELLVMIGWDHPAILLVAMIVAGAAAYVVSALLVAREAAKDLLSLLKKAIKRSPT
jgi:lipopolysaccharide exporter